MDDRGLISSALSDPLGPIAILGNGSWGTALAIHLAKNGQRVLLWGRQAHHESYLPGILLPAAIETHQDLGLVLDLCQAILIAVPSHGFLSLLEQIKPHWSQAHHLVWATKGLDKQRGCFLDTLVHDVLGQAVPTAVLSGPSFAKEVALGLPTAVVVASAYPAWSQALLNIFGNSRFRVYPSEDLIGVQLGGVLKNIMAVAAGISDGLGFGANARAALITRGIAEMIRLGEKLGAQRATLVGLAGCGDMILSCTDDQSRNRRFGLALAAQKTQKQALAEIGQVVEAIHNIDQIHHLSLMHQVDLPITHQVFRVLHQDAKPEEAVNALFSREPTQEYFKDL